MTRQQTRRLGDLKLHRVLGLLLHDHRAGRDPPGLGYVPDAQRHQVTAAQLAVDS